MTSAAPVASPQAPSSPGHTLPPLTVERLVRPHNKRMMWLWALLAAVFAGWLYWMSETLWRIYNGPEPVTVSQLLVIKPEQAAGRFFDVTSDIKPAHLLQTTTETRRRRGGKSTSITNHFALIQGGTQGSALLVETSQSELANKFFAWSAPFQPGNTYYDRAVRQLGVWTAGRATIPFAPVLLRTSEGPESETTFYGSVIGAAVLGLLALLVRFQNKLRNFMKSGTVDALYTSVRAKEGVPALVAEIDQQLAKRDPAEKPTGWELFPNWLVVFQRSGPQLWSVQDIMWVAAFTKGKQHLVKVVARDGKSVDLVVSPDMTTGILGAFHHRAPWAVIGPDPAFEANYIKKSGIFAAVKRQFASQPSKGQLIKDCDARRAAILAELARTPQTAG